MLCYDIYQWEVFIVKIITENAVYVQKNDIAYLNHTDLPIPASIFIKVFGNGVVIIDDSNRYEFEKVEDNHEIEFFKRLDWIVDYNSVKDLSDDEIIEIGKSIAQSKNQIAKQFNSMSENERKENLEMVTQCELLDFKMYSLRDILWFKQGHLKMTLPIGIDYPKEFVQKNEKGMQKLMRRIFPKRKN